MSLQPALNLQPRRYARKSTKTSKRVVYNVGELFCGAGGFALGAKMARFGNRSMKHVWANDFDADACETFRRNFDIDPNMVIESDVRKLNFNELPSINGLLFGFPCNDFSVVGERQGLNGEYGGLYRYGAKALRHFQPEFFVAENVGGIQSANKKVAFSVINDSFKRAGYDVFSHLYKFEEYGVPQARHRYIFVGFRKDLHLKFSPPMPSAERLTARQALANIPKDAQNNDRVTQKQQVVERLAHIKPGENAFTANLPEHLKLSMRSGATISVIYRRLKPDAPSYTVTGSGGGGTHLYHWKENRALTNRERARLQTFPDSFVFAGNRESVRKQKCAQTDWYGNPARRYGKNSQTGVLRTMAGDA